MGLINSIGTYFKKVAGGFVFGTQIEKITIKGSMELQGDGSYEHTFPNKNGTIALLDDVGGVQKGTATMVAGSVTIPSDSVAANSLIFFNVKTVGGTLGIHYLFSVVPGVSFTIKSVSGSDTSTIVYAVYAP